MLRHVLAILGCLGLLLLSSCNQQTTDPVADPQTVGTVTIEFDQTTDLETAKIENVAAGTTLEQVMRDMKDVKIQGSGTSAFVAAIGKAKTTGGKGWTFKVDGEWANQGVGGTKLTPPTTITWSYGSYDEIE